MSEQFQDFQSENPSQTSEFKINTLLFCTQQSIAQTKMQDINQNSNQTLSQDNPQVLQKFTSMDTKICSQITRKQTQESKQNSDYVNNSKVEQNYSSTQMRTNQCMDINDFVESDSQENSKIAEKCLSQDEIEKISIPQINCNNNGAAVSLQNYSNNNKLNFEIKNKQQHHHRVNNHIHKSNSVNIHNKNKQNTDFDNRDQNGSDQYESELDVSQPSNGQIKSNIAIQKEDSDLVEKNSICPGSVKKSRFHFENNQQDQYDNSSSQNVFYSAEQENKHKLFIQNIGEYQSLDNCKNVHNHPNLHHQAYFRSKSLQTSQQQQQQLSVSKFQKVKNAIITIQRLSNNPATPIHSVNQLEDDMRSFRASSVYKKDNQKQFINNVQSSDGINSDVNDEGEGSYQNKYKEAFDGYRNREKLRLLCERGAQEDLKEIKKLIDNDPKKYLRDPKDPEHFLNKKNSNGLTPLYIASKNGNLEVLKILLFAQCDYMLPSNISKELNETPLETALRWNHVEICKYMLERCVFEDKYLMQCLPLCQTQNLKILVEGKIKKKSAACTIF